MTPPPVPPAEPGEHQFWTDPILCEETRARLEHFRSLGWLPPNFKPKTLEGLAVVERYWRKYCIQLKEDYVEYLLLEDPAIYMNFFDWMYKTLRKKLLQLYDEYWRRLCQYFGVLFLQKVSLAGMLLGKRKGDKAFQSDLPKYVLTDDLPASVCYRDIELFYLKDPDSKRDVLCAIIEFRNLKGRPEGADGTKFFMHGDYQLAYCPINQIVSLAFRDGAFLNMALNPELIWRLRKLEKLDTPLFQLLQELGRDARFEDDIGYYNYCRWTANEVNWNFTSQEWQRVLGQSGDVVFEKHYQLQFINSLSDLTDAQKHFICQNPEVLELRWEKRELMEEIHKEVKKELSQLRKTLEYFHTAPVLEVDRQIKQLLGQTRIRGSQLRITCFLITKDMVALSQLCEPTCRGNRINWDVDDNDETEKLEEPLPAKGESLKCPMNVCIICCGQSQLSSSNPPPHKFRAKWKDSLRCHLIDSHLAHAHDGISCTWPACHGISKFTKVTEFLVHAVIVHAYDINIKLHHLPAKPYLTCSDTSSVDSIVESVESCGRSGTDTPASSVGPEMANIDPRLLEPHKPKVTDPLLRRSKRLRLR
ncbi:hypothetical protein BJX76DRAFT_366673 [Aspergillus varians]